MWSSCITLGKITMATAAQDGKKTCVIPFFGRGNKYILINRLLSGSLVASSPKAANNAKLIVFPHFHLLIS